MSNLIAKKGRPRTISSRALSVATGIGRRITKRERRYQKPFWSGLASASAWRRRKRGAPALTREPSRVRTAGRTVRADRCRQQDDQRPAQPHRVEEALREDQQRGQRRGDGQRGEEDGAPRRRHHPSHRRQARAVLGDLLAVAGDDEEAVVDRQAQPSAVVRLRAKTEIAPNSLARRRIRKVPTIASPRSSAAAPPPRGCGRTAARAGRAAGRRAARPSAGLLRPAC